MVQLSGIAFTVYTFCGNLCSWSDQSRQLADLSHNHVVFISKRRGNGPQVQVETAQTTGQQDKTENESQEYSGYFF